MDHNDVFHFSPLKLFRDSQDAGKEVRFSSAHPSYLETPGPGDSKEQKHEFRSLAISRLVVGVGVRRPASCLLSVVLNQQYQ